jgi:hypothetical protein
MGLTHIDSSAILRGNYQSSLGEEKRAMATFEGYAKKYQTIRMERRDGILQITFHTDGDTLQWGELPHREFPRPFTISPATPTPRW